MKVESWCIGETAFDYLDEGVALYDKRLRHFLSAWEWVVIPNIKNAKNMSEAQLKDKEGELLLKKIEKGDFVVLLDERGKAYTSLQFASYLDQQLQQTHKRLIFIIGGAYGFSEAMYERANGKISLSNMTFSHQMIRLFWVEQLYRAMSILNNQPYHHE